MITNGIYVPPDMKHGPSIVGFVPARSGSKRVPGKNIRELAGHPLMAYSICSALDSGIFDKVVVSTDSVEYAEIARRYGADVTLRPPEFATDTSPDIEWLLHALGRFNPYPKCFAILRPVNPFRKPETIRAAWEEFRKHPDADSLRAVEPCSQHPGKMWRVVGDYMYPLLLQPDQPFHSSQYAALPRVYVQNASLEIAWAKVPLETNTIAGELVVPFFTSAEEGTDVNNEMDWAMAVAKVESGEATLPDVREQE